MMRHLTTLVLCGVLGSMVLVGNAEACHKRSCGHAPVVCAAPRPVPCVTYAPTYTACAPKVKHCSFKLPTFCHHRSRSVHQPLPHVHQPLCATPTPLPLLTPHL